MPRTGPISIEQERRLYYDGIALFNGHAFFEAHEAWEDIWRVAYGLKHAYCQGLIQCAVALEHYRRGNPRGVVSLHKSYRRHFEKVPDTFMGLDVHGFLIRMHCVLRPVVEADPMPERNSITLDVLLAPQIELLYDPYETGEAEKYNLPAAAN